MDTEEGNLKTLLLSLLLVAVVSLIGITISNCSTPSQEPIAEMVIDPAWQITIVSSQQIGRGYKAQVIEVENEGHSEYFLLVGGFESLGLAAIK